MTYFAHFEEHSLKNHQQSCFFDKVALTNKTKHPAGMLVTEVRSGDAPKPKLSMKTNYTLAAKDPKQQGFMDL